MKKIPLETYKKCFSYPNKQLDERHNGNIFEPSEAARQPQKLNSKDNPWGGETGQTVLHSTWIGEKAAALEVDKKNSAKILASVKAKHALPHHFGTGLATSPVGLSAKGKYENFCSKIQNSRW